MSFFVLKLHLILQNLGPIIRFFRDQDFKELNYQITGCFRDIFFQMDRVDQRKRLFILFIKIEINCHCHGHERKNNPGQNRQRGHKNPS